VRGPRGRTIGRALYSDRSQIALRAVEYGDRHDEQWLRRRIDSALEFRAALAIDATAYRLIHGEADLLPSLVVDRYGDYLVVQALSQAMDRLLPDVIGILSERLQPKGIVARNDPRSRLLEGLEQRVEVLAGEVPDLLVVRENGLDYEVDVRRGQKTGFFLDQRENRALVRRLSAGASVLNCFSFSGGFSVNAALGGASRVFSVDQDADAIALARENFGRNGLDPNAHDFLAADVFTLLSSLREEGRRFDIVVLDPPAFAKSQRAVEAAIDGYASLNRQALEAVAPGGLLVTASCSARVTPEAFEGAVASAGVKAGVDLTLVEERYQPPDHPIRLQFPEGRYLKFLVLRVTPW